MNFFKKKMMDTAVDERAEQIKVFDRLLPGAGSVIAMLKGVLSSEKGTDMFLVTLFAAGLAGIACHEAVKANGEELMVVECDNGKKYFMGEALNQYLCEDRSSVSKLVCAAMQMPESEVTKIIEKQAKIIGTDNFVVAGRMDPEDLYRQVKSCWDGIKSTMTLKYCENASEWPILYGMVLQNIMGESMSVAPKEAVFKTAMDVVIALSKMDKESL